MMPADTSYLIDQLNEWYDNKSADDQLYYADARSELEEKLHILEAVEKRQRVDYMLTLSNLMYRSLLKPDEAAVRANEAATALMEAYLSNNNQGPKRALSLPNEKVFSEAAHWKRLVDHYDGVNLDQFIKTTAVYFKKRSEKWGGSTDLDVISEVSKNFIAQVSEKAGGNARLLQEEPSL